VREKREKKPSKEQQQYSLRRLMPLSGETIVGHDPLLKKPGMPVVGPATAGEIGCG
jgi:hypothetical protein